MKKALTIAGSDSGGGAGIQADLKTFQELNVYGMSALTAVTAQNTIGVQGVFPLEAEAVAEQIHSVGVDIGADALKTGMLFNAKIIRAVAENIEQFRWETVVVDPVMIAKGGAPLLQQEAVSALKKYLLPLCLVITPNIPEAEVLTGMSIRNSDEKREAAKRIHALGARNVIIKGGHDEESQESVDLLFDGREFACFSTPRIETRNTHGTGCTFSAAITAELAKGSSVYDAVSLAKDFINAAIRDQLHIGNGHGPTNHWAFNKKKESRQTSWQE
ncbi:bifunctional hydroxymethylpyrimidine kinase/phosphomethylpyrimidine kinase [Mesobacillus subterraneus]|uniref:bifunctional hydroxymethylpyrimidine kinase/phosphomethylpyrimidine kinase n=1 Tax=Mesobacillus subterraneus TaxID=285983 RepID=UPI00203E7C3A|nr:bifunctional hydroxymethylpyrimidine kinase/phosphomethylpyrimidine kinase [Mesobacillus subterraneus]MCM3666867.1 bifunctional hydroxymethylpyrimidine kinase/phosphomethylpyrimidine kinase [Mesobacillus subterraneus]MCM3684958.1 bifunctional hydroxymethylpyrimidine kinase/phosphomethylpyrimidine kinase [Mesobacillus subterraneus]